MLLSASRKFGSQAIRHASQGARAYHAPLRDMRFLIRDVYNYDEHYKNLKHCNAEDANSETLDMMLDMGAKFCENVLAPINEAADREGCKWIDEHHVQTPKGFKEAYDQYVESGFQGMSFPEEYGGQGLPQSISLFLSEMMATANWTWMMYPGLSKGCINTILAHGSDDLKKKYLEPLIGGQWTGTMCLTEPQCGSDLGQVTTKAEPNGDGTYSITGTKIFISCGEHDMAENIIHCVLARLPGAPEGTKGISLFLVPKRKVDDSGASSEEFNGCNIGRIEDKMGCHGSSTCEINFENAQGYLIGTENRGLNHMFTFINTSRMGTAVQGIAAAEASYQNALPYAKDRISMRALSGKKAPDRVADPIIYHPSVRQLLLFQKVIAEGGRSMVYECGKIADLMADAAAAGDHDTERKLDDRLGFLTPILKGFLTEMGLEAANNGIQVFGGHGYIKSNKQEQIVRDVRIAPVWEGTTQIQALDLLGRKIMLQKLKPINEHCSAIQSYAFDCLKNGGGANVRKHAIELSKSAAKWQWLTYTSIARRAVSNKEVIGHASVDYLMLSGYVSMAHHWLKMEVAAEKALASGKMTEPEGFYRAKIQSARFYFDFVLPRINTHIATIKSDPSVVLDMKIEDFSHESA